MTINDKRKDVRKGRKSSQARFSLDTVHLVFSIFNANGYRVQIGLAQKISIQGDQL